MKSVSGEIDLAFQRNRGLQLKEIGSGERAYRHLQPHGTFVEAMPEIALQTRQHNVGHDGTHSECRAWKSNIESVTHKAAAPVSTDEIAHTNNLIATLGRDVCGYPILILFQCSQLAAEFRPAAQLREPLAQRPFGQELRNHQSIGKRLGRGRVPMLHGSALGEGTIAAILTLWWIKAAQCSDPVNQPEVFEDLLRARLDSLTARATERTVQFLYQAERDSTPRQVHGECKAGGTGSTDQHISGEIPRHCTLQYACILHIYE